jgi:hypothetical protein
MLLGQPSTKFLDMIEANMRAVILAAPKIGLFMAGAPALTVGTLLADLIPFEPTFTGYARQVPTIGALRGDVIDPFASITFQPSAPVSPGQTVIGVFLTGTFTAVDYLLLSELLDTPFTFTSALDALDLIEEVYMKNLRTWGGVCTTCP